MSNSIFLKNININKDWKNFINPETLSLLKEIEKKIFIEDFTPSTDKVLRFLTFPLSRAKVILLGQDPYPQSGAATGRAFEVGYLNSWNQPFKNISLKNILRALYKSYTGEIIKYTELKEKIDNEFPILPPDKLFCHWENQGVLLLNTSFTCKIGTPGSHKKIWEKFSSHLLTYIQKNALEATWFLWGNHAQDATKNLKLNNIITTMHPMMCYKTPGRNKDFLYGDVNCFEPFIDDIDWTGYNLPRTLKKNNTLF